MLIISLNNKFHYWDLESNVKKISFYLNLSKHIIPNISVNKRYKGEKYRIKLQLLFKDIFVVTFKENISNRQDI